MKTYIIECLQFIMSKEQYNFLEKPTKDHIYYKAYATLNGKDKADEMLQKTAEWMRASS